MLEKEIEKHKDKIIETYTRWGRVEYLIRCRTTTCKITLNGSNHIHCCFKSPIPPIANNQYSGKHNYWHRGDITAFRTHLNNIINA